MKRYQNKFHFVYYKSKKVPFEPKVHISTYNRIWEKYHNLVFKTFMHSTLHKRIYCFGLIIHDITNKIRISNKLTETKYDIKKRENSVRSKLFIWCNPILVNLNSVIYKKEDIATIFWRKTMLKVKWEVLYERIRFLYLDWLWGMMSLFSQYSNKNDNHKIVTT